MGARLRHGRLDQAAGGALRRRWPAADLREGQRLRHRRVRLEPRPDRADRQDRARLCAALPDRLGPRPLRLDDGRAPAAGRAARGRGSPRLEDRRPQGAERDRGDRARRQRASEWRARARKAARRRSGGVQPAALGRLRPAVLLPDRAFRGFLEPGPVRRCPLRVSGGGRRRHPPALRTYTRRGLRRRAEAPDHARYLRALGRLLRGLLRPGPEGANADQAGARRPLRALRPARIPDLADGRVPPRRADPEPARHVPLGRAHDPLEHGGPARAVDPLRPFGRPAGRAAADRAAVRRERALPRRPCARAGARLRPGPCEAEMTGGVGSTGKWEAVIGLEIHVQLKTETKMFCRCRNAFGDEPNTNVCPVCLAFPGTLPVPNRRAIEECIKLGLALDCTIAERAVFHRKNYFYPDNPKAYQISQYDEPLCSHGKLTVPTEDGPVTIGITRAHLEEDAAKNVHVAESGRIHGATATLVDFNRGGTPLVEIVTEPDLRDAETAKRFLQLLRQTVVELGLSDAELEKGSMRFDVNVSVRPAGSDALRTRTELKNMNSFNFAAKGIEREIARQIKVYEGGGTVEQETLHFDPGNESSPPLRSKEEAQDYRYFPDPDLVPVHPPEDLVERLRSEIGELPGARITRLAATLSFYDADVLVTGGLDRLWSDAVGAGADAKEAANVLSNQFVATGTDPA